jgi:dTDP-4-dehydrorhamnose 3,5-epimerase
LSRIAIASAPLAGLKCVMRQPQADARGFLSRLFCVDELAVAGWRKPIAQINHTYTKKLGTVRGMHYQNTPHAEMKLVSCIRGEVFDVVIDLRAGSPTFLKWHAEILSAENGRALLIPEGFAHGFQTLTDGCNMVYLHTASYAPDSQAGIRVDDPLIGITWPLAVAEISLRDREHPLLTPQFKGMDIP